MLKGEWVTQECKWVKSEKYTNDFKNEQIYYSRITAGDLAAYSLATDWDVNQVWAVISPFLKKYGRAKISDLEKLIGSHVSEKRLRSYLDILRKEGQITTEGKNKYMYYVLAKGE